MKNIFIAAHYNLNNGDRAVLEATIQMIQSSEQECSITVSAYEPQRLGDERCKVVGWPIKNNKVAKKTYATLCRLNGFKRVKYFYHLFVDKEYLDAVDKADVVLISGGHHLTDILGAGTCYQLAINYIIPILRGKKVYLLPQSIGPVKNEKVRADVKYILDNVQEIAYRDKSSESFLRELQVVTNYKYIPDVVYTIKPTDTRQNETKSIGVALYCNYSGEKREKLMPFVIDNLKQAIKTLLADGYNVNFIPMEIKGSAADDRKVASEIIRDVEDSYKDKIRILEPDDDKIVSIVNLFSGNDVNLAYKTHSVVFSTVNYAPVVAIAYHPKSVEFMQTIDLEEYAINDANATCDSLLKLVEKAITNKNDIVSKEKQGVAHNVEIISDYFNAVLCNK